MATIVDSYSEDNQDATYELDTTTPEAGQAFTGDGGVLNKSTFYLKKTGSPTGNAVAKIYAETHATAFGTDSKPTGSPLATSDNFDVSALTTSFQLIDFIFSGANKITLTNGAYYVVTITSPSSAGVIIGYDFIGTPSHSGNYTSKTSDTWSAYVARDLCFYVYKDSTGPISPGPFPTHIRV